MSNFALTRLEHAYMAVQTVYGTAVAASNTNACRHIKLSLDNEVAEIDRKDKTGSRTPLPSQMGRKGGKWNMELSLAPNGAAGTAPDCDALLQSLFGIAPTVVASTSVTYNRSDAILPFSLWSYRLPSTIDQRVGIGCTASQAVFNMGQDGLATFTAQGDALWVLEANQFGAADATQKGGLSSFAAEPSTPVFNGTGVVGFTGSIVVAGQTLATVRTAKVTMGVNNVPVKDTFGTYYSSGSEGDEVKVTNSFSLYEDDSTAYNTLVAAAEAKTPVSCVYTLGTVAGNRVLFTVNGVKLMCPTREEQRRYIANFGDGRAFGTSPANRDELVVSFT